MKRNGKSFLSFAWRFIGLLSIFVLVLAGVPSAKALENSTSNNSHYFQVSNPPPMPPQIRLSGAPKMVLPNIYSASVLDNQMDSSGLYAIASQNFEYSYDPYDSEAADDFVVPTSDGTWVIQTVDVFGACINWSGTPSDCGTGSTANIRIYKSLGTVPGDVVYSADMQAMTSSGYVSGNASSVYEVALNIPAVLMAGSYWISIQVNRNYASGSWVWNERTVQSGNPFSWRNPGNGWGSGCTGWCSGYGSNPDLNFRLNGTTGNPNKVELSTGDAYSVVEHSSQPIAYASIPASNSVVVVNTATSSIQTTILVGSNPKGLAISPDSSKLFVALNGGNAIKVIDTSSNAVVNTFPLSYSPVELEYGGPGHLYVSGAGTIRSLDPSTGTEIGSLPSTPYGGSKLAISPDGKVLCDAPTGISPASIACYNISTDSPPAPWTMWNVCSNLQTLDISGDGTLVYIACGSPYNIKALYLNTLTQAGLFNTGAYPDSALDSPNGRVLFGSGGGSTWMWNPQTYLQSQILDSKEVTLLEAGSDNHTVYASDKNLVIYHFTSFQDVGWLHWARAWIERLYSSGITGGCNTTPLQYCPETTVTRAQMAVFLERGMHGSSFNPSTVPLTFTDTSGNFAQYWIEALKSDGITGGCGTGIYCPDSPVTRAQMAIFLLRSEHGSSYNPPPATGTKFTDVPASYWAAAWIEQLANEGITGGCGTGTYCPDQSVTRAQMAVFLVKTFGLP